MGTERQVVDKVTRHLIGLLAAIPQVCTVIGLIYASVLLIVGCAIMLIVPIPRTPKLAA